MSQKHSRVIIFQSPSPRLQDTQNCIRLDVTERQLEILSWVEQGKSATDIGGILGISHRTVEHHLEKVCSNFGVRTRFQAVLRARDLGLIGRQRP